MKEVLLYQLESIWSKPDWFVTLKTALEGLTEQQASVKTNRSNNSIWEILNHLIYWNELYLERFKTETFKFDEITNDQTFENRNDLTWQQSVTKIRKIFLGWEMAIQSAPDDKLNKMISAKSLTWSNMIMNLITHTAYHTGQIITIRKEQQNWDPAKGVS